MLTTKSLGSINELLIMEKLLCEMANHFVNITKDKNVQKLLGDIVAKSQENKQAYLQVLESAK